MGKAVWGTENQQIKNDTVRELVTKEETELPTGVNTSGEGHESRVKGKMGDVGFYLNLGWQVGTPCSFIPRTRPESTGNAEKSRDREADSGILLHALNPTMPLFSSKTVVRHLERQAIPSTPLFLEGGLQAQGVYTYLWPLKWNC